MASADSRPFRSLRGGGLAAGARRAAALARRIPLPVAIVVGGAIVLRVVIWIVYQPAVMNNPDTLPYVDMAAGELFSDPARPAGYSMFLRGVHSVSSDLDITIALQHLLGLVAALLLYATVRRIGAPLWAAVVAAAAVLLSVDQILLEHTVIAESLFVTLLAGALYASVRAIDDPRPLIRGVTTQHGWIALAGATLGLATWVRGVGMPLIPFLALWVVLALPGPWRTRLVRGALAAGTAVAVVLVYFALHSSADGHFGLTEANGWALYGRVGQFADCDQFDPPEGTEPLCEETPTATRPGPDFYTWEPQSPAQQLFGYPAAEDEKLGAFAREAILNQPLSYGFAVFNDTVEFFAPGFHDERPFAGSRYDWYDVQRRDPAVEPQVESAIAAYYPGESLTVRGGVSRLSDAQQILRVHPILMLQAVILAAFGIWFARGRARAGLVLLLGAGLLLLVVSAAVVGYNVRYAIPAGGPLIAAGAVGLWVILRRVLERRDAVRARSGV
jgi:Dolichyl-phosphate-mannose-protein mannosyltransferase